MPNDNQTTNESPSCNKPRHTLRVHDWTAADAGNAIVMEDDAGTLWRVERVEWDGTVHVVAGKTIRPDERVGWRAHLFQHNA
ncbi:MAG: hypothetical protein O3C21_21100 [Verrucomicrobia bacterium]|nr:hypothetical protein [Verrucomicrobiota bacterium]